MNPRYERVRLQSRENPARPSSFTRTRVSALLFPSVSLFPSRRAVYRLYSVDYYAIVD